MSIDARGDFDLGDYHYLNCAYMGPLSRKTQQAGLDGIRRKANPRDLQRDHFFCHSDQIRELFASIINVPRADSIAIIPAVSYGMAIVAENVAISPGQKIIVLAEEMPSNYYIWKRLCEEKGARLSVIDRPSAIHTRGLAWNEQILAAIDEDTALVAVPHVHWLDGALFRLEEISAATHRAGGVLIVDGTQSIGALPFDNAVIKADAVICAGYKWLLGPYSIGVAYLSEPFWEGRPLEEGWLNREKSWDFPGLTTYRDNYRSAAIRFDVGESSNFVNGPMLANALGEILSWTPTAIARHCGTLTDTIAQRAAEMGYASIPFDQRAPHYIGLKVERERAEQMQLAFQKHDISVSVRGDSIRVTPHIYNNSADSEAVLRVLQGFVET